MYGFSTTLKVPFAEAQWGRLAGYRGKLIAGNGDTVAEKNQEPDGVAQDGAEAQIKRSEVS